MRYTKSDITKEILSTWDYLMDNKYPEDILNVLAYSAVPTYNNEIISDWQLMPNEYDDSWKELVNLKDPTLGIIDLMKIDLENYYRDIYREIYDGILKNEWRMDMNNFAKCVECNRVFNLLDEDQAGEWFYGHDCEG